MRQRTAVVAIGGNSLIKDTMHQTVRDQYIAANETCEHIVSMIADGWNVVIVHGNGPQIGFILRRSELAAHELHELPLDVCGADAQGALGYALQQNLYNEFRERRLDRRAVTLVTQVEVDARDPDLANPSKPIGSFMSEEEARRQEERGWQVAEDASRGWRRIVPSPRPLRIVEEETIRLLSDAGVIVIAAGGGGIPVVAGASGDLQGVAAVVDKDRTAALLASNLEAELLLISTSVDRVALRYGTPEQTWIDRLRREEAAQLLAQGDHFGRGSMAPKIEAAIDYLRAVAGTCLITSPGRIEEALAGKTGTLITR